MTFKSSYETSSTQTEASNPQYRCIEQNKLYGSAASGKM